jgi:ferredoxin
MATVPETAKAPGLVPDELKQEPRSKGILTPRKKKPKELAVIPDYDHPPFGRIEVDPLQCIGCKKCLSKGPEGAFLDGCPWDAIVMVDIAEVEKEVGPMSY